jgi:hypothetical protein
MTRISSLFVATTLAILPISAFAQQNAVPVKTAAPVTMTTAAPATTAPIVDKTATAKVPALTTPALATPSTTPPATTPTATTPTATTPTATTPTATTTANVTQPAKSDVKVPATGKKTEVHGMNTVTSHHAKATVPAKTAEPAKS